MDDIAAILERLSPGMWLRLDSTAFTRFFGRSSTAFEAAGAFASKHRCVARIKDEGSETSAEFTRPYATPRTKN